MPGIIAPATLWRAFLLVGVATLAMHAAPPLSVQGPLAQFGKPDDAEAARILAQYRQPRISGTYYLEFELHSLPRRGEETIYRGRMWGTINELGPITRVELVPQAGATVRLLIQSGPQPAVWRFADPASGIQKLDVAALFDPVIPGLQITAFDLQRPFVYWPDAAVEKIARVRGRPANAFLLRPPAAFAAQFPQVSAVREYLDTEFNVTLQTEVLGPAAVLKTLSLGDIKKSGEQWLPKTFDARDEVTRDKTRLVFTVAGLNLAAVPGGFSPGSLGTSLAPPAADRLVRL